MPDTPPARARPYQSPSAGAGRLNEGDLPPGTVPRDPAGKAGRLSPDDLPQPPRWALSSTDGTPAVPPLPAAPPGPRPSPSRPPVQPRAEEAAPRTSGDRSPFLTKGQRRRRFRNRVLAIAAVLILPACAWIGTLAFKANELGSDWFVTPPPRPAGSSFPDWSKQERVNILLMGLDTRQPGDSRSDTMILASIDPRTKTAAMLSIPRDLWVDIPGVGANRINAAYNFGELNKVPGGGAALAMQTVQQDFGVPVHYYAQVDFSGFRRIVDALGGVTVDVQRPLIDNEYPADYGFAYQRIYIPAGIQHMDGRTALQYVRSRHTDSDLGRNERQQGMLLALREQGLQIGVLGKLDRLLSEAKGAVRTDLSPTEAGSLAKLAAGIPRDQVRQLSLTEGMTSPANINGADVLSPNWPAIHSAVRQLLGQPDPTAEAAVLGVMNGTDTPGLALRTADQLRNAGFTVPPSAVGNPADAGNGHYPTTQVIDYTNGKKPATLDRVLQLLKLDRSRVRTQGGVQPAGVDIEVLIGDDLAK